MGFSFVSGLPLPAITARQPEPSAGSDAAMVQASTRSGPSLLQAVAAARLVDDVETAGQLCQSRRKLTRTNRKRALESHTNLISVLYDCSIHHRRIPNRAQARDAKCTW